MLVELKRRLREISDLNAASDVLNWDQATYMPEGGAGARGRQRATLNRLAHERAVEPALGGLIDELTRYGESLPYDSDDASLIRVARREFQKKIKIPPDHVERATVHFSASYDAWTRAWPGQRLRNDGALSRTDAGPQPRLFLLLYALQAHRRSAHRRRRRGHDRGVDQHTVRRTQTSARPDGARDL